MSWLPIRCFPDYVPANLVIRTTFNVARMHFFARGVSPKNADDYLFRVKTYTDNTLLIRWTHPC